MREGGRQAASEWASGLASEGERERERVSERESWGLYEYGRSRVMPLCFSLYPITFHTM